MNPAPKRLAYLVDDEPMVLDLNEEIVRSLGFDVRRFRAGEYAIEAYRKESPRPAIVITDYSMHAMTGLQLVAACRALEPDQPIIMLSGTVDASVLKEVAVKPDCFLSKPYSPAELSDVIRKLTAL